MTLVKDQINLEKALSFLKETAKESDVLRCLYYLKEVPVASYKQSTASKSSYQGLCNSLVQIASIHAAHPKLTLSKELGSAANQVNKFLKLNKRLQEEQASLEKAAFISPHSLSRDKMKEEFINDKIDSDISKLETYKKFVRKLPRAVPNDEKFLLVRMPLLVNFSKAPNERGWTSIGAEPQQIYHGYLLEDQLILVIPNGLTASAAKKIVNSALSGLKMQTGQVHQNVMDEIGLESIPYKGNARYLWIMSSRDLAAVSPFSVNSVNFPFAVENKKTASPATMEEIKEKRLAFEQKVKEAHAKLDTKLKKLDAQILEIEQQLRALVPDFDYRRKLPASKRMQTPAQIREERVKRVSSYLPTGKSPSTGKAWPTLEQRLTDNSDSQGLLLAGIPESKHKGYLKVIHDLREFDKNPNKIKKTREAKSLFDDLDVLLLAKKELLASYETTRDKIASKFK